MKKQNNEITIKINISDDMLSAITNALMVANLPVITQPIMTSKAATPLPPSSPIGFRAKGGK